MPNASELARLDAERDEITLPLRMTHVHPNGEMYDASHKGEIARHLDGETLIQKRARLIAELQEVENEIDNPQG